MKNKILSMLITILTLLPFNVKAWDINFTPPEYPKDVPTLVNEADETAPVATNMKDIDYNVFNTVLDGLKEWFSFLQIVIIIILSIYFIRNCIQLARNGNNPQRREACYQNFIYNAVGFAIVGGMTLIMNIATTLFF